MLIMQGVSDDRHKADQTFIKYLINDKLISKLLLKAKKKVVAEVNIEIEALYADDNVETQCIAFLTEINATAGTLKKHFNKLVRAIYDKANTNQVPVYLYLATANYLSTSLQGNEIKEVTANGRIGEKNEAFHAELQNNIFKFGVAKSYAQVKELSTMLTDEKGELKSYHKFKDEALKVHEKYNKNWLKTEYNQVVKTAHMADKWRKWKEDKDLYDL
ncbi:MAG: hypothetical protein KAH25_04855 [Bacteroidales bacterium]|nr:hypothetical protein [Bacteroidales bacterium]